MAMTQDSIVVGVFQDPAQARCAIDELKQAGYSQVLNPLEGDELVPAFTRRSDYIQINYRARQ